MFGERRNSILPIIFDIANIIKRNMPRSIRKDLPTGINNDDESNDDEEVSKSTTPDLHRTKRSSKYEDDRPSYHERKLNMTNFRGTPESNDQHAIESRTRIHVSLPNSNVSSAISLEEMEDLAFKDLNGTIPIGSTDDNATNLETLPEPEMLIRPYRVRPRPISERFDNIYLYVVDYPM